MSCEFSAVVSEGVVYSEPGMLLNHSEGRWLPDEWEAKTDEEAKELMVNFLLDPKWSVTKWSDLTDEDLDQWIEDIDAN